MLKNNARLNMRRIFILIILLLQLSAYGQPMSEAAKKIMYYYNELEKVPHAPVLQIKFISSIPGNKVDFMEVFNAHTQDQLAVKGVDYVKLFRKLGYDYADSVLPKAINIGKDMPTWSEGVVDELQKTIYYITNKKPQMFADIVGEMKKSEQISLARFLYSSRNGKNENYEVLLQILEKAGQRKAHKSFMEATTMPLQEEDTEDF